MKRAILIFCVVLTVNITFAQLYVKNNSYVFNKGTVVYSKGNLELNGANSNFYLRNEGQFLQGTTGSSTNTGDGKLSVFQEGTVNNYVYNYWCSPVGGATAATSGNEDFGITMLNLPSSPTASTAAGITTGYNGSSSLGALSISNYWIFRFLALPDYSGWSHSYSTSNIAAGQGFTMKGTSGTDATTVGEATANNTGSAQRYDFRGKPNDGNISVGVALNNFTLTGNPYPSALHVNAFLLDGANTDCTGIAYYWEQDKTVASHAILAYRGGYGTFAPGGILPTDYGVYVPAFFSSYNLDGTVNTTGSSSGLAIERKYAPIGQGFMIKGKATGSPTTVTLRNSHRAYYKEAGAYSQFEKSATETVANSSDVGINSTSHLRLNTIINNQNTRQIALTFMPQATDGVDRGIDALSPDPDLTNDVYFFLENEKYVIEGINFDVEKRVPLGVNVTNNTSFKFSLVQTVDFEENQPVYIYDDLDGTYHDIRQNNYEVTLPTGVYNDRFEITFKDNALVVDHPIKDNVIVVQNNANELLTITNPNLLNIKSVAVFDILGKQIFSKVNLGSQTSYEFSTSSLSDGVYLVNIKSTDGQRLGQKILVSSK